MKKQLLEHDFDGPKVEEEMKGDPKQKSAPPKKVNVDKKMAQEVDSMLLKTPI